MLQSQQTTWASQNLPAPWDLYLSKHFLIWHQFPNAFAPPKPAVSHPKMRLNNAPAPGLGPPLKVEGKHLLTTLGVVNTSPGLVFVLFSLNPGSF